jgi:hypothetical protein
MDMTKLRVAFRNFLRTRLKTAAFVVNGWNQIVNSCLSARHIDVSWWTWRVTHAKIYAHKRFDKHHKWIILILIIIY